MTKIKKPTTTKTKPEKKKSNRRGSGWGEGTGDEELQVMGSVEEQLEKEGIRPFGNSNVNDDYLQLPQSISETTARELGEFLNTFTQQKMWTRTLLGRTSSILHDYNKKLDAIRGQVYNELPAKMSVKEKELRVKTSPEAKDLVEAMTMYEEKYRMLQDYFQNLEDGIFNISREISRRGNDFQHENRLENVGRKR